MKLYWKPQGVANAHLVAEKSEQLMFEPVLARVYIKNELQDVVEWGLEIYVSELWHSNRSGPMAIGFSTKIHDSFKQARTEAEIIVIGWFKRMGVKVIIEKPEFEKEKLWSIKSQTICE